jgi:hypothetical protein
MTMEKIGRTAERQAAEASFGFDLEQGAAVNGDLVIDKSWYRALEGCALLGVWGVS